MNQQLRNLGLDESADRDLIASVGSWIDLIASP